jgi:hypothetical protein
MTAKTDAEFARERAMRAIDSAAVGQCRRALGEFAYANRDFGRSHHGTRGRGAAEHAISQAQTAITNNCIFAAGQGFVGARSPKRRRR